VHANSLPEVQAQNYLFPRSAHRKPLFREVHVKKSFPRSARKTAFPRSARKTIFREVDVQESLFPCRRWSIEGCPMLIGRGLLSEPVSSSLECAWSQSMPHSWNL
jgi:hypothetical protein